jgi:hypothetical protein
MATSTHTHDYLGRALANASPGITDPVLDFLGREVSATADFLGRNLVTP